MCLDDQTKCADCGCAGDAATVISWTLDSGRPDCGLLDCGNCLRVRILDSVRIWINSVRILDSGLPWPLLALSTFLQRHTFLRRASKPIRSLKLSWAALLKRLVLLNPIFNIPLSALKKHVLFLGDVLIQPPESFLCISHAFGHI